MARVRIYATRFCPFCVMTRRLLKSKGVEFEEVAVDGDAARRAEMRAKSGRYTVPQIWIGECHVGGYEEIAALDQAGQLDPMLKGSSG